MPHIVSRGWTLIESDTDTSELDTVRNTRILDMLAAEWSRLKADEECENWRIGDYSDDDGRGDYEYEDPEETMADCHCPDECGSELDYPGARYIGQSSLNHDSHRHVCYEARYAAAEAEAAAEIDADKARRTLKRDLREAQMQVIEEKLHAMGARMMRPYEHWNEDESYMRYMEEGRHGHYSD